MEVVMTVDPEGGANRTLQVETARLSNTRRTYWLWADDYADGDEHGVGSGPMEPERTTISMGPVIEQWVRENTRTGAVSRTDVIRGLAGQVSIPTLDRWFRAAVDQGDLRRTYRSRSVYYQWTGRD